MRLVSFSRTLFIIGFAGFIGFSCNNELDPQSPDYVTIPVVYSVLELHRDTLSVRVTKTFSGLGSALNYARIEDSVYFPVATVWLEKWNGDFLVSKAELIKTDLISRLPGTFLEKPNWNYILVRSPETEPLFTGSIHQEYHLIVEIPGLPLIFAKTKAYPSAHLLSPRLSATINIFLNPLEFAWKTEASYSEMYFKLYYTDVYPDTTIARSISWREYHSLEPGKGGTESIFGQDIMKRIVGQVRQDRSVSYRPVNGFQVVIVGIPADLYEYRLMNQVQPPDQIGFPVTNIINGIGLFTSQTINSFDLELDPRSKDSIMIGQYTKHLNFRFY
ncbi:MAG: DUF4249 family protein [Porphyromonadaceae bacterium]|nr:MAG: DUF4249 family protein [Porphyromonadaceae bacterium]